MKTQCFANLRGGIWGAAGGPPGPLLGGSEFFPRKFLLRVYGKTASGLLGLENVPASKMPILLHVYGKTAFDASGELLPNRRFGDTSNGKRPPAVWLGSTKLPIFFGRGGVFVPLLR